MENITKVIENQQFFEKDKKTIDKGNLCDNINT
jgi:hypothetical protein